MLSYLDIVNIILLYNIIIVIYYVYSGPVLSMRNWFQDSLCIPKSEEVRIQTHIICHSRLLFPSGFRS